MRIGVSAAVLAALVLCSPARGAVVEEFKAVDWDGLAFTSDETGEFTHCSVYAVYRNGSTLFISYEVAESWYLSISNDSWSLGEGGNFAIKFKIDRRGEIEGTGVALSNNQIGLPIEADHPFVGQLRRGNQLTITFQNQEYAFELSNSNRAMNAAQDCVRRHVQAGTRTELSRKPAGEAAAPAPAPAPEDTASDSGAPDAVAAGEQQEFGSWVVTATDDGAGTFVNCTAYGVHGDDQLILSLFPDGIWTFGLYRSAWSLDTNQTYYLWYNVDGPADAADVTKRPVEAAEPTRIFFEVSDVEDIIERIEAGDTLNLRLRGISGPAEDFSYPLDRVSEAFAATRECVSGQAPAEEVSKDGSGAKGETSASGPSEEAADESADTADSATDARRDLPELGLKLIEEFDVPGWKAAAFSLDDGTFTHCAIKAEYQNGATLGVARAADGDWVLAIQHGDWSLDANAWVPISYEVKGETPLSVSAEGQAVEASLILANIGGDELTDVLSAAREMTIGVEGKSLAFDVSDIGPGIEAIEECIERNAAGGDEPAAPPPAAKKAQAPPVPDAETDVASADETAPPPGPDTLPSADDEVAMNVSGEAVEIRTEAAGYTTALLFRAGYPNHVILGEGAVVPENVPPGEAMWELGEVMGSTKIVSGTATPDDIKSSIGGGMLDKCGGILNTQIVDSDATHMHFTLKCGIAAPTATHFVVLPREGGGSYVFAMLGAVDDIAAGAIAEAVYNKAVGG